MKRTSLYEKHLKHGGKMIDFFGWCLPLQYTSIIEEHRIVREGAGLFDVSHMGEITVEGTNAGEYINRMITNDISKKEIGQATYSPMCNERGGIIDDLIVYRIDQHKYMLVVNASNTSKDFEWLKQNEIPGVKVVNESDNYTQLALQGPKSKLIIEKLTSFDLGRLKYYRYVFTCLAGFKALISRTGYTGESGYEIYVDNQYAKKLWDAVMEAGEEFSLVPVGLGARDTLRMEAALPLYGRELNEEISPLESGLHRFVCLEKGEFAGRDALIRESENGTKRKLIGFEMKDKAIPRNEYKVLKDNKEIGFVTSGGYSPTLDKSLGMALVKNSGINIGDSIKIRIRKKEHNAKVTGLPFYKRNKK